MDRKKVLISKRDDLIEVRSLGRSLARDMGFGLADRARLSAAILDLGSDLLRAHGRAVCYSIDASDRRKVRMAVHIRERGRGKSRPSDGSSSSPNSTLKERTSRANRSQKVGRAWTFRDGTCRATIRLSQPRDHGLSTSDEETSEATVGVG